MNKVVRGFLIAVISIVCLGALATIGGLLFVKVGLPRVSPPADIRAAGVPDKIERGRYLAHHVAACIDCHSARDWTKFAGPLVAGSEGQGGEKFGREFGFPGNFYSRNITPVALGSWTDGEVLRAITAGVNKKGEPLFPVMPYPNYSKMSRDDAYSLVAFLKTLPPNHNQVPPSEADFPVNLILRTIPEDPQLLEKTPQPGEKNYGEYLTTMASCVDCHTQFEKGSFVEGMEFAGGREFLTPWGTLRSSNITPDPETGIGSWSKENFIARFKSYDLSKNPSTPVRPGEFNTLMPWTMYAGMTEEDLGAIYDYLRTLKPMQNRIEKFTKESN